MKRFTKLTMVAMAAALSLFVFSSTNVFAQDENPVVQHGPRFIDENGDGYNDLAPDHDGDGIPNGQDPDYVKPEDGSGNKMNGKKWGNGGGAFIDEDGDGICDNFQDADGDGIPNCEDPDWVKPEDGSGNQFGRKGQKGNGRGAWNNGERPGTGECDGTGPQGSASGSKAGANRK